MLQEGLAEEATAGGAVAQREAVRPVLLFAKAGVEGLLIPKAPPIIEDLS